MSKQAPVQVKPTTQSSVTPAPSGLLQRKCSCQTAHKQNRFSTQSLNRQPQASEPTEATETPPVLHELLGTATPRIQPKLKIGAPNDKYEQEADRIADQVMRMPDPSVQRQMEPEEDEDEEMVQTKAIASQISPLIQRQVDPEEEEEEPLQMKSISGSKISMLQRQMDLEEEETIQAKFNSSQNNPVLQRKCTECKDEERIQPKLKIGAPNDKYEQEADRIADQVMQMPSPGIQRQVEPKEEKSLQMKLISNSRVSVLQRHIEPEDEESLQATYNSGQDISDLQQQYTDFGKEERIQTKPKISTPNNKHIQEALASEQITQIPGHANRSNESNEPTTPHLFYDIEAERSRGQCLPANVQAFMESRFGADFRDIRIHTTSKATELVDSVNAQAFTVGNDIFLSASIRDLHSSKNKHLLAHELTHTIQQGRPSNKKGSRQQSTVSQKRFEDFTIQRKDVEAFWIPESFAREKNAGQKIQDELFASADVKPLYEIGIPNAARKRLSDTEAEYGLDVPAGRADLYAAEGKKPIGVNFKPESIHGLNTRNGLSRPRVSKGDLVDISEGPKWIKLGEIKPAANRHLRLGRSQLEAYKNGIEKIAVPISNKIADRKGDKRWVLDSIDWITNSEFTPHAAHVFPGIPTEEEELVLASNLTDTKGKPKIEVHPQRDLGFKVKGGLFIHHTGDGLWAYFSRPSDPAALEGKPELSEEKKGAIKVAQAIQSEIVDPVTSPPIQTFRTPEQKAKVIKSRSQKPIEVIQRKVTSIPRAKDTFKAQPVFKARKKLRRTFEQKEKTKPFQQLRLLNLAYDAEQNLDDLKLPAKKRLPPKDQRKVELTSRQGKKIEKVKRPISNLYSWADLWTHRRINLLARFRERFGSSFVTISNKIRTLKDKIKTALLDKFGDKAGGKSQGSGFGAVAIRAIKRGLSAVSKIIIPHTLRLIVDALVRGLEERIKDILPLNVDQLQQVIENGFQDYIDLGKKLIDFKEEIEAKLESIIEAFKTKLEGLQDVIKTASKVASIVKWAVIALQCGTPPLWGCAKLIFKRLTTYLAEQALEYCPLQKKVNKLLLSLHFTQSLPETMASVITERLNEEAGRIDGRLDPLFAEIQTGSLPNADEVGCEGEPSELQRAYQRLSTALEEKYGSFRAAWMMDLLLEISQESGFGAEDVLDASEINKLTDALIEKNISVSDLEGIVEQIKTQRESGKPLQRATVEEFIESIERHRESMLEGVLGQGFAGGNPSVEAKRSADKDTKFGKQEQKEGTVQITSGLTSEDVQDSNVTLTLALFIRGQTITITKVEAIVKARNTVDEDEQIVDKSKATQIEFKLELSRDHFANLSNFNLGTVEIDGKTVPLTSYKLPQGLELSKIVPLQQDKNNPGTD